MKIEFTHAPKSTDIDFLTQKINEETPEFSPAYSFAFFVRDGDEKIIAGCNGSVIFGEIYTDQLWVRPSHRKTGLGRQLMERIHQHGLENGCSMATVSTMSFQGARGFYEKLGYRVDFERQGYEKGSTALFLRKEL